MVRNLRLCPTMSIVGLLINRFSEYKPKTKRGNPDLSCILLESGDHLNANPKCELLAAEIEKLRNLVDQHQKENDRIRQYLLDKRNRLTRCTNILSHFPESIPNKLLLQKDQEISPSEMADETNKTIKDLELEMQQKERQFEKCCCQLIEQLNEIHDNNQALSDTLSVITQENKNNVEVANNLKNELNR
uniref:Uncharacterized protein n=1 Tax=Dendroctonus ponderosae TaxID=77166 RepID=A0AAR5NY66_DENPD